MRILYFSRDYTTHDHRFLAALAQSSHEVAFLRLERRGHLLEDRPLPPQVQQIAWEGGQAPAGLRNGPRLLAGLKHVMDRLKPDIVQAGPLQRSAFLVALAGFRPLVSMSWGYDLIFDAARNAWWRWATRYTLQRSAAMVGDSAVIRRLAISYGMKEERIVTFPWGVDLRHFSPLMQPKNFRSSFGFDAEAFVILSTRSWEPIYGVDVLARAFAQVAQEHTELKLIMLGNGSLAPKLRRIFAQAGVEEQVFFPGQVGQSELPRYYQAADLYLSASHSDGASISLLEALACGRPVLLSDIPGNREWISAGEQGWFFKDGDVQALAQAMRGALAERQRLPEMGRAARSLAEQRADWEKNFPHLFQAYEIALSRGRGS